MKRKISSEDLKHTVLSDGENGREFRSFFYYLSDMYSFPGMTELRFPAIGKRAKSKSSERIRGYFTKALGEF